MNAVENAITAQPWLKEYVEGLKVWYEFMKLASAKDGLWDAEVEKFIKPRSNESSHEWLERCWPDLEPAKEFPVVVHETREDMLSDWIDEYDELHITINVGGYSKKEILDAVGKLIEETPAGRPSDIRQRAMFQPNTAVNIALLEHMLAVYKTKKTNDVAIGEEVLGKGLDEASVRTRISRYRKDAKELVNAVRQGKFPNPDKRANGER